MRHGDGAAGEFAGTFWEKPTMNSFESGWEIYKPVIAAVNGYCLGYGLTLVTWCDFVIASDRAEFGFPEVRLGVPTIVGAMRLPQRINWQYAMELLLTGERIGADRARQIGLAGWVVPHDRLLDEARALADRLVAAAPLAARAIKELAVRAPDLPMVEAIRFGETMRKVVAATEDAAEGGRAAAEGRTPRWQAR
jgi:enoyl-CoA hydratase/carnithine racemase